MNRKTKTEAGKLSLIKSMVGPSGEVLKYAQAVMRTRTAFRHDFFHAVRVPSSASTVKTIDISRLDGAKETCATGPYPKLQVVSSNFRIRPRAVKEKAQRWTQRAGLLAQFISCEL
jgi:hypothetical protein